MAKKVSIRDVAKACGISPATVSRVLSGSGYPVSGETRKKVLQTARQLDYRYTAPSQAERVPEIAVLVPTIANPFYTSVVHGVEKTVTPEGYCILIYDMDAGIPPGAGRRFVDSLLAKNVSGVVVAASNNRPVLDDAALEEVRRSGKIVLLDSPRPDARYNCVSFDYERGAYLGAEYLIQKQHRHICYAGLHPDRESRHLRMAGFQGAMRAHGLDAGGEGLVILQADEFDENAHIRAGEVLCRRILGLAPRPTAVFAMNDLVALGLLHGLHHSGVRVPQEISVMGFDDSVFSEIAYPAISSVRVQAEQMGHMAAMLLLEDIRGAKQSPPVNLFINPSIVERDTVARPGGF